MMNGKVATAAVAAILSAGVLPAAATPAIAAPQGGAVIAASCYENDYYLKKPAGNTDYPVDAYRETTRYCSDINIKPENYTTNVKVCFAATGCQSAFKKAPAGKWTVIATNVRDGARFWFRFDSAVGLNFYAAF